MGVAAVAGNGQKELGELLMGLRQPRSGTMCVDGRDARWSPAKLLALGFGCLPEDPLRQGAVAAMTGLENMMLPDRRRYSRWGGLGLRWKEAAAEAQATLLNIGLGAPSLDKPLGQLSGGNVQRVVFAREVGRRPRLLITFYPTHGMDVPSAEAARQVLRNQRATGTAIVLVSEDLDELFALSDRIVVLHHGRVAATLRPSETTQHSVGLLMTGADGTADG